MQPGFTRLSLKSFKESSMSHAAAHQLVNSNSHAHQCFHKNAFGFWPWKNFLLYALPSHSVSLPSELNQKLIQSAV